MLAYDPLALAAYKEISRKMSGGVKIYDGSTVSDTLLSTGKLVSWKIERSVPSGKFFGYVAIQNLKIEILGDYPIAKGTKVQPYIDITDSTDYTYGSFLPFFFVDSVEVNDTKTITTITCYDYLNLAKTKKLSELTNISFPIILAQFASRAAESIGATVLADFLSVELNSFNFTGDDTIYDAFVAIAEATGTICYARETNGIRFRFIKNESVDTLTPQDYFEFQAQSPITLTKVVSATELGDDVPSGTDGYTQTFYNNRLIEIRDDRQEWLNRIIENIGGSTLIPNTLNYRGNPFYEMGDGLAVETLAGETKIIHVLSGDLTYSGGFSGSIGWEVGENEDTSNAPPPTLTEAIKRTYAKVDRVNNSIDMLVSQVEGNAGSITQLQIDTTGISASVKSLSESTKQNIDGINDEMELVKSSVDAKMTSEDVQLAIKKEMSNGVDKVETSTGFTFNETGLTVSKSNSQMETTITEDGMRVYRNNDEVLIADNQGVKAEDLHATTYLIIGNNSRFEDYGNRTACFWIGG